MTDVARPLLIRVRDQFDHAVRAVCLSLILVFLFHLLTLTPYLELNASLVQSRVELSRMTKSKDLLAEVSSGLKELSGMVHEQLKLLSDRTVNDIRNDIRRLEESVRHAQSASENDPDLLSTRPSPMMQMPLQAVQNTRFPLDEMIETRIRKAATEQDLLKTLRPVVEEQIIALRFDELNSSWRESPTRAIAERTAQMKSRFERMQLQDGPYGLGTLYKKIQDLGVAASRVKVTRPSNEDWWRTVPGKGAAISSALNRVVNEIGINRISADAEQLFHSLAEAVEQHEAVVAELQEKSKAAEEAFAQQKEKLSSLGKPLEFVSVRLETLAAHFPLLIGLLFACEAVWLALRWRNLSYAMRQAGTQTVAAVTFPQTPQSLPLPVTLIIGLACLAWIWFAAWQIIAVHNFEGASWAFPVTGSLTCITGLAYLWISARKSPIASV